MLKFNIQSDIERKMIEQSFVVYLFIFYTILKDYFTFTVIKKC